MQESYIKLYDKVEAEVKEKFPHVENLLQVCSAAVDRDGKNIVHIDFLSSASILVIRATKAKFDEHSSTFGFVMEYKNIIGANL